MGILQHHDAVSGTEKQHVANDYAQRVSTGIDSAIVRRDIPLISSVVSFFQYVINEAYKKLLPKDNQASLPIPEQFLCQLSNISECLLIEGQNNVSISQVLLSLILNYKK
jgi:hypothetical protein